MARIKEWADLSELGDNASLLAAGWGFGGNGRGTTGVQGTTFFLDALGNGGLYGFQAGRRQLQHTPQLATPVSTFYVRMHFRTNYLGSGSAGQQGWICHWNKGLSADVVGDAHILGGLQLNQSTGQIQLWTGNQATLLATSTLALSLNTWYTIEVGITIGTSGAYEVRVNNTSVGWIPPAVGNTKPTADTNVDFLYPCNQGPTDDSLWVVYFDDLACDTAGFIGESLISALHPNGNGTTIQLTGVPLTNWQNIDEIPPSDTDYNETLVANKKDTYVHTSLPGAASTVKAVMIAARVVRTGSAIGTAYPVTRSAGTDYESAGQPIPPTAAIITDMREVDPATSAAWTVAAVNASEIGIRFDT